MQHLAVDIERFWFRGVVAGEAAVTEGLVDGADDAWQVDTTIPAVEVFASYRDEIARANAIVTARRADMAPAWWPGDLFGEWRSMTSATSFRT